MLSVQEVVRDAADKPPMTATHSIKNSENCHAHSVQTVRNIKGYFA